MFTFITALLAISQLAFAYRNELILCEGFWGGNSIPFPLHASALKVEIEFASSPGSLTIAVYAFEDRKLFEEGSQAYPICYQEQVTEKRCNSSDVNKFIISNNSPSLTTPILNEGVHWHGNNFKGSLDSWNSAVEKQSTHITSDSAPISYVYNVSRSGYYCVLAIPDPSLPFQDYSVQMYVQNPYGALPAIFYPALPFFATQLAAYLLVGLVWGIVSYINRKELLRMQNLIGAMILFLILENCVSLAFFVDFNNHGFISKSFLGAMVALNAGRNSLSFFMVLVVCLGYGVVHPTLGSQMYWAIGLTIVHFIFGALYFTYSMLEKNPNSFLILLFGFPLAITLFIFYVCILLGISTTVMYLESKRQSIKLLMYKRLYHILVASFIFLFIVFIANGMNMLFRNSPFWIANQFKWRWLLLDGALNTNYFIAFCAIAYLWIPTRNNGKLALEQIGTEDIDEIPDHEFDDFELDSKPIKFGDFSSSFLGIDEEEIEDLQPSPSSQSR